MFDTVLITGGSKGIGAAAVREFAKAGKRVAFTYFRSEEEAHALAEETGAYPLLCDVRSQRFVTETVMRAKEWIGSIEILINNAGVSHHGLLLDMKEQEWHDTFAANTDSVFYMTQAVLPDMISMRRGRVINVSSIWGTVGASCESAYSASKAALHGLTRSLAKEYASCGITFNAIAPGVTDTDMNSIYTHEEREDIISSIPVGRMADPCEIAYLMQFLASERAAYITGQIIGADGGFGQ